ncbi:hypothetical protein M0651_12540 [Paenibacillus sp. MBLB2552]|uniref:Uncharacterized protein n=1 Tax=Paenibacillus mellifer TaxID=2937794 RepID=A0A9X1Y623_9BACL|nr:hypothetical protein [Paenibacillus mellifer]MCK8488002.1 hypothetical protein [Paenibacillus mellifer]
MIRMFKSKDYVQEIELVDLASIQAIIQLTGMGVTVIFTPTGDLQSVTFIEGTKIITAIPGQFVYKNSTGTVGVCNFEYLDENYEEVTEPTA